MGELWQQSQQAMASPSRATLARPVTTLGNPKVPTSRPLDAKDGKFVELNELTYRAANGTERRWESTNRKTRKAGVIADAVDIFTQITHPKHPPATILVLQFRPPVDAISVEFPAGLIDEGESPEQAALRELAEETGYGSPDFPATKGRVIEVSEVCADSPGMSTETTVLVSVRVDLDDSTEDYPEPKQDLDEGEFIEKRIVYIKDLYNTLREYQKLGYMVDTRLHHLAYGLKAARALDLN